MIRSLLLFLLGCAAAWPLAARPPSCLEGPVYSIGAYHEQTVEVVQDGVTLVGRLLLPRTEGPHPGVVLLPGGGRHAKLNYTPLFVAARLARCGIAALVLDKRGTGRSEGDWHTTTFDDLVDDAAAAHRFLRARAEVRPDQVGLVGFSQGGRLAPVVAARTEGVAFVVGVSAPYASPRETRLYALGQYAGRRPYTELWREPLLELWTDFFDLLERGQPTTSLDYRIERLGVYLSARVLPPFSYDGVGGPFFQAIGRDDVAEIGEMTVPMLALYGARDEVVPVAASVARLRAVRGASAVLTVTIVPGVDHAFGYPEGRQPRFRFEDVLVEWVLARVGRADRCAAAATLRRAEGRTPDAMPVCTPSAEGG